MKAPENQIKVLMVDDEKDFLLSSKKALNRRGIDVQFAFNGAGALKTIEYLEFDVAVLDVKMPGMDGIELLHQLKKEKPDLPVIMLTGHGSIPKAFEASKDGVFDYLAKPCEMDTLAAVIRDAASQSRAQDDEALKTDFDKKSFNAIKVLLVDDEIDLLTSLRNVLQRRDMEVVAVQSGEEALGYLQKNLVQVAVLDMKMPGMDGLKVLQHIKVHHPDVVVIMLTGHPTVDSALTGMKEGAFDYIIKPPDMEILVDAIRAAGKYREDLIAERQQDTINEIRERYPDY